jgi:hypothetical protein
MEAEMGAEDTTRPDGEPDHNLADAADAAHVCSLPLPCGSRRPTNPRGFIPLYE